VGQTKTNDRLPVPVLARFDKDFWTAILKPGEFPTEAHFVTEPFDREEEVDLG
jgi:hypothetical protein